MRKGRTFFRGCYEMITISKLLLSRMTTPCRPEFTLPCGIFS